MNDLHFLFDGILFHKAMKKISRYWCDDRVT